MATRNSPPRKATTAWMRFSLMMAVVLGAAVTASAQTYTSTFAEDSGNDRRPTQLLRYQNRSQDVDDDYDRFDPSRDRFQQISTRRYDTRTPEDDFADSFRAPLDDFRPTDRLPPLRRDHDSYDRLREEIESRSRDFEQDTRYDRLPSRPQRDDFRHESRYDNPQPTYSLPRDDRGLETLDDRGSDRTNFDFRRHERRRNAPRFDERLDVPGARDGRRDDRVPNDARPQTPDREVRPEEAIPEAQKRQMRITARYGNPVVQRFVQGVSTQQAVRLYQESMQLIDTRHIQPSTYDARVREAIANLSVAVEQPGFQQANRVSLNSQQVRGFQNSLNQVASSRPVQSANDAMGVLQASMDVASQQAGIRPAAVVLEFVYGGTDSLDKYSTFMPDETASKPSAAILDDHVVGIGVEIMPDANGVAIKKTLPGGPAQASGLQAGDVIVGVDGRSLKGQSMDYAVDLITGRAGTPVQLSVVRGNRSPGNVSLVRRQVKVASVSEVKMLDAENGVGYIKLEKFAQASEEEMDRALWSLNEQGMKSLVFDLRGNPGGLLNVAVGLADKFLPAGTIVATRGRTQADNTSEGAHRERTWKMPLVVLVDSDSASASEIFAAAIQDNGRGVVVGRKSYGKGTVQTHFPLQSVNGYLKLTTAKFYSPNGREMAGQGVEPDVYVATARRMGSGDVPLGSDDDVAAAVRTILNPKVQEMATNAGRNNAAPTYGR